MKNWGSVKKCPVLSRKSLSTYCVINFLVLAVWYRQFLKQENLQPIGKYAKGMKRKGQEIDALIPRLKPWAFPLNVVKKEFLKRFQIEWLEPFGFMDSYVVLMRRSEKSRLGLTDVSSLVTYFKKHPVLKTGIEPEVYNRPDYHHFLKVYDITFHPDPILMDFSLLYDVKRESPRF